MRITSIAFGLGLLLAGSSFTPSPAWAQKIIIIKGTSGGARGVTLTPVRIFKFGRVAHGRFSTLVLPHQTLYPPYYRFPQPYAQGPDMRSRIKGGRTARRGSPWRGRIEGGKTVEQGAPNRSRITGGRTVEGGSRWASRIRSGRTIERGSPWAGTISNWRFTGYAAPMRPKGISYYRVKRRTGSPWGSRLR